MEYKLDASHKQYITVKTTGVITKSMLIAAISELMNHPEYPQKHTLWNFSESSTGLTIGDLKEIASILSLYKPKDKNFANKSAIVVPGQMHSAMADLFITMAKLLPFDYKAFRDIQKAKAFLESK